MGKLLFIPAIEKDRQGGEMALDGTEESAGADAPGPVETVIFILRTVKNLQRV